jgi:hypothetical protein
MGDMATDDIKPHIYPSQITDDETFRENVLAFADRHDFDIAGPSLDPEDPEAARDWLQAGVDHDLEIMINNGRVEKYPARELATDEEKLEELLDELREVLSVYAEYYPEGHCFAWHEEPLFGNWEGETLGDKADVITEYGADIYAAMKRTAREVAPDLNFGIFIHQPFVAGPDFTDKPLYGELMDQLRERDALPDFGYIDMYRGYYEWEGGFEATNDYLNSILTNAKEHLDGRPVYYLGEAHTINNHYTPSKQSIQGNFRTAAEAGVDGYGWYVRGAHRLTHERNYNPFLPNDGTDGEPDAHNGWIGARDRMQWASLLVDEHVHGRDRDEKFDLWVHGNDLTLYETQVELDAGAGFEYVGDVSGYVSGPVAYDPAGRDWVSVIRGLDRSYLDGGLDVRLTGNEGSDGATVHGVYAAPYSGTTHFRTEPALTDDIDTIDLDAATLGGGAVDATLAAGDATTASFTVEHPDRVVEDTPLAVESGDFDRLADVEAEMDSFADYFDLWVYGDGLDDAEVYLQDSGFELSETELTDRAETDGQALVLRGLARIEGADDVRAVYLMPYHGPDNLKTPADVADIVEREFTDGQGMINRFAVGAHASPVPVTDGSLETWLDVNERHIYEQVPFDYHPSLPWPPWYLE